MAEKDYKREIEREAEDHIALGLLLRKERSEQKKSAVEKILHSERSIAEKIEKIKLIDDKDEESYVQEIEATSRELPVDYHIARIQQAIKMPLTKYSYWAFLFQEYRKIRDFGKEKHIFYSVFFPPGVRISPELPNYFGKHLLLWAAALVNHVNLALEIGWLYLSRYEYNLLAVLKKLCDKIISTNFIFFKLKDRDLIGKLRSFESLFLILHYRSNFLERIIGSLKTVLKKDPGYEGDFEHTADLVKRILLPDASLPSLYNFFLGLNMFKYRRFLNMKALIRRDLGNVIPAEEFDCSRQIRKKINAYIRKTAESLKNLHEQLHEINSLKSYLTLDDSGEVDLKPLKHFYEAARSRGEYKFSDDIDNIMVFAPRFLSLFEKSFYSLLNGKVSISGIGKVEIFSRIFFQMEFPGLKNIIDQLEKISFNFSQFPHKRYLLLKSSKKGAISVETKVMQLIDEAVSLLVGIGKQLSRILSRRQPAAEQSGKPDPLDPIVLKGKSFNLPYEDQIIITKNRWQGKTVLESLSSIIRICFTASVCFYDQHTLALLEREERAAEEIKSMLEVLKRIADPKSFRELEAFYA
ncbi:hypothetical protein ES703_38514 [subsurface metagenome]